MATQVKAKEQLIGKCIPDDLKDHLKKYVSQADYGYVAHLNGISLGTVDRILRNNDPIPVTVRSYPAILDLIQLALQKIDDATEDAKVSKKTLNAAIK